MSLPFDTLKRLSFTHSAIYLTLLVVWIVPGLHQLEFVFGMAHGLGWIAMCILTLAAVRARVIPIRLGIAVSVIGAIGPFIGSYEFVREERRRDPLAGAAGQAVQQQGRWAPAAEVEARQADPGALEEHGTNRQRGSVH